jgi:hypothetical protein
VQDRVVRKISWLSDRYLPFCCDVFDLLAMEIPEIGYDQLRDVDYNVYE